MSGKVSNAFMTFSKEAPVHAQAWGEMISKISEATVLDAKTSSLVYIGVLAALGIESGIAYHVAVAKNAGASKEEVLNAALIALPPAGHKVTQLLPAIVEAFDN